MEVISKQMEKTLGRFIIERFLLTREAWKQKNYRIPKLRLGLRTINYREFLLDFRGII